MHPITPKRQQRKAMRHEPVPAELKRHPGKWALLAENESGSNLVRLRESKGPLGYEFVARDTNKQGAVGKIYARFVASEVDPSPTIVQWEDPPPIPQSTDRERRATTVCEFAHEHPEITMVAIARHFGLSPMTVSRYLNADSTKERRKGKRKSNAAVDK